MCAAQQGISDEELIGCWVFNLKVRIMGLPSTQFCYYLEGKF